VKKEEAAADDAKVAIEAGNQNDHHDEDKEDLETKDENPEQEETQERPKAIKLDLD